jgi:hypothetical protein
MVVWGQPKQIVYKTPNYKQNKKQANNKTQKQMWKTLI